MKRKTSESISEVVDKTITEIQSPVVKMKTKRKSGITNGLAEKTSNDSPVKNGSIPQKVRKEKKRKANGSHDNEVDEKKVKVETDEVAPQNNESIVKTDDNNQENEEPSGDECEPSKEKLSSKEASKYTGKFLRKSFNAAGGLDVLRKFVSICNENKERDLAAEYLQSGGSVLEILRLLDTNEKKNLSNVTPVFSAMHILIMKILDKCPQYQSSAEEACRHFVNHHLSSVHSMLSNSSIPKQRKIVLRLLASMVSLGGNLPRELLGHLSFHQQTLDLLTEQTKPTDPQSVRTSFIHFILAFLVDSNVSIIRTLLEKRDLLSSIFSGLIYDSHMTVHLVLSTIKTYVLENQGISKTSKLRVFSTPVLQSLVSLYNWKGPKNWPGPKHKKKATAITEHINPEEKEVAVEAVHDFLMVLLTSSRHGVIFNDKSLGTSGKKNNQLVNTILQSLDRPWEHAKPCELVSKVLAACPDLIRPQLTYTEPFLEPRVSNKWISVIKFVQQIIENINPEILKPCLPELSSSQLISATLTLSMPLVVLKSAITPSINAASIILRHEAIITLTIMLNKMKKILDVLEVEFFEKSDFIQYKSAVKDYILKNMPNAEAILEAWTQTGQKEETTELNQEIIDLTPKKYIHYFAILDLLQAYREVCSEFFDVGQFVDSKHQPDILLTSINEIEDLEEAELNRMKIKAIQIVLALNPTAFEPQHKLFSENVPFLISILENESTELRCQAKETTKMLLESSEIFEGCPDQIDIWLNTFSLLENDERIHVAEWLVKIIRKTCKGKEKYLAMITEAEAQTGDSTMKSNRFQHIFSYLMERDHTSEQVKTPDIQPPTSIPLILCSAFDYLKKNSDEIAVKYISFVSVFTLHCQVTPEPLIHLSQGIDDLPTKYLMRWKNGLAPIAVKKPLTKHVVLKFSKELISSEEINLEKIFQGDEGLKSTQDALDLFRMTLFYLTYFIQQGNLTQNEFNRYKSILIFTLDFSKKLEEENESTIVLKCSKLIVTHPVILQHFSPVPKIANDMEVIVTNGLLDIFKKIAEINSADSLPDLFLPFKDKLMMQLRIILTRNVAGGKRLMKSHCLLEFVDVLKLRGTDVQYLLKTIMTLHEDTFVTKGKKFLSVMGKLAAKLLGFLADGKKFDIVKDSNIIQKFCTRLSHLKLNPEIDFSDWELSLLHFFKNFPHTIAKVDLKIFNSLLENIHPSTLKLIAFLTGRNAKLIPFFVNFALNEKSIIERSDIIFSVLSSNPKFAWDKKFLKKIYKHYKKDIFDYFSCQEEIKDWIPNNVKTISFLIDTCGKLDTCEEISRIILSNGHKLEAVDLNYVELVKNLFKKFAKLSENPEESLTTLLQILIRVTVSALKKDSKNLDKLEILCDDLCETIQSLKLNNENFIFEELNKNHAWPQFTRFSLKLGLKTSKDEKKQLPLLRTLTKVCEIAYANKSEDEYVKTLFEMTTSHSEFVNLMLSTQEVKKDLLQLLYVLVKKNHSIMTSSHIPLYLSAYNATLKESDQWILRILQYYETENISFSEYKPYLFGEAAVSHYSIKGEADTALWRQPSISRVLELFNFDTVKNTIRNYPVRRNLKVDDIYEEQDVYDPAFYLPLFTHLLADNNVVACHKVTQTGALALVIAACGSESENIRMAAFTVISRFYFHLEATQSREKHLWIRFLDSLRNGISSLETPLKSVQLSCLVSNFLAKASLISTQPIHELYQPLQKFFMAKSALDLNTIPEFLTLFQSSDINHIPHRHYILQVIRDGLKTDFDTKVANKCFLFKLIFTFYDSILADSKTKNLILQIIEVTTKIPKAAIMLVRGYSLLVWLHEAAKKVDPREFESINVIIKICRNILNVVLNSNEQDNHTMFMTLTVLKALIPKLCKGTNINIFSIYLRSMKDILHSKLFKEIISTSDIEALIEVSKKIIGDVKDCEDIVMYGTEFLGKEEVPTALDNVNQAAIDLTTMIINWQKIR